MFGSAVFSIDPNGYASTSSFTYLNKISGQTTVDNGTSQYLYDNAGRPRFMMDANGAAASPNNILYWKYDKLGRIIEKGYFNNQSWSTVSQAQNLNNQSFPATPATWRKNIFTMISQLLLMHRADCVRRRLIMMTITMLKLKKLFNMRS